MRTRTKVLSAIAAALVCSVAAYTVFFRVTLRKAYGELPQAVIAHAAGAIDGNRLTNSLEALEHAIACGVRFIELDLRMTSDDILVAVHDWGGFADMTGIPATDSTPPSYADFRNARILHRYTPLTYELIDSVFAANPRLYLVTDKLTDVSAIDRFLPALKPRMLVECFSAEQYRRCIESGIYMPLRSYNNLDCGGVNVVDGNGSRRMVYLRFLPTTFAVYRAGTTTRAGADSVFAADRRVRFYYVDELE